MKRCGRSGRGPPLIYCCLARPHPDRAVLNARFRRTDGARNVRCSPAARGFGELVPRSSAASGSTWGGLVVRAAARTACAQSSPGTARRDDVACSRRPRGPSVHAQAGREPGRHHRRADRAARCGRLAGAAAWILGSFHGACAVRPLCRGVRRARRRRPPRRPRSRSRRRRARAPDRDRRRRSPGGRLVTYAVYTRSSQRPDDIRAGALARRLMRGVPLNAPALWPWRAARYAAARVAPCRLGGGGHRGRAARGRPSPPLSRAAARGQHGDRDRRARGGRPVQGARHAPVFPARFSGSGPAYSAHHRSGILHLHGDGAVAERPAKRARRGPT